MTINLDTEIVATRYDPIARTNFYTIEREGKRWTAGVHDDHFTPHGPVGDPGALQKRRAHLAKVLTDAMAGPPDPVDRADQSVTPSRESLIAQAALPERATVTWKPAWYDKAAEIAAAENGGLAENAQGYLVFTAHHRAVAISFEGIDPNAPDADALAYARIEQAAEAMNAP